MSKELFNWNLEDLIQLLLIDKNLEQELLRQKQQIATQVSIRESWPQEALDEEFAGHQNDGMYPYIYAILSTKKRPGMVRNLLMRLWNQNEPIFLENANLIRYSYPETYTLMAHVLQYGPLVDWKAEVAYDAELDSIIEEELMRLNGSYINHNIQHYIRQYPECGMLKAIKAMHLLYRTRCDMSKPNASTFPGTNIMEIGDLLTEACRAGIPNKYKYFMANYLRLWIYACNCYLKHHKQEFMVFCDILYFPWFIGFVIWDLFPNSKENQELILSGMSFKYEGQIYYRGGEEHVNYLKRRIQFGPKLTIEDANNELHKWCSNVGQSEFWGVMGCLTGVVGFIIIVIVILWKFLFN